MGEPVAFTAVADKGGKLGPFGTNQTVEFNKVITNIGRQYDSNTGKFTAAVRGVYFFTFSYHGDKDPKTGLQLMKNGELIVKAFDDKRGADGIDNSGNSALLSLNAGDTVFVSLPAGFCVWAADNTTTFSGFLVR